MASDSKKPSLAVPHDGAFVSTSGFARSPDSTADGIEPVTIGIVLGTFGILFVRHVGGIPLDRSVTAAFGAVVVTIALVTCAIAVGWLLVL